MWATRSRFLGGCGKLRPSRVGFVCLEAIDRAECLVILRSRGAGAVPRKVDEDAHLNAIVRLEPGPDQAAARRRHPPGAKAECPLRLGSGCLRPGAAPAGGSPAAS